MESQALKTFWLGTAVECSLRADVYIRAATSCGAVEGREKERVSDGDCAFVVRICLYVWEVVLTPHHEERHEAFQEQSIQMVERSFVHAIEGNQRNHVQRREAGQGYKVEIRRRDLCAAHW